MDVVLHHGVVVYMDPGANVCEETKPQFLGNGSQMMKMKGFNWIKMRLGSEITVAGTALHLKPKHHGGASHV